MKTSFLKSTAINRPSQIIYHPSTIQTMGLPSSIRHSSTRVLCRQGQNHHNQIRSILHRWQNVLRLSHTNCSISGAQNQMPFFDELYGRHACVHHVSRPPVPQPRPVVLLGGVDDRAICSFYLHIYDFCPAKSLTLRLIRATTQRK